MPQQVRFEGREIHGNGTSLAVSHLKKKIEKHQFFQASVTYIELRCQKIKNTGQHSFIHSLRNRAVKSQECSADQNQTEKVAVLLHFL